MKILLIAEYFKRGGTFKFLLTLIKNHSDLGFNTHLLIEKKQKNNVVIQLCEKYNAEISYVNNRPILFCKPYASLVYELYIWIVYIRKIKYDILIISNSSPWMNFSYFLFVKAPIAYFTHCYPDQRLSKKFYLMYILPRFLNGYKKIVAVSIYGAKQIMLYMDIPKRFIKIIYNSIPIVNLSNNQISHDSINVLTAGRLSPIKNPDIWLKVIKYVVRIKPETTFTWVGGNEAQNLEMYQKIEAENLIEYISLVMYKENITELYKNASIYFQPSLSENHSISVIEAMLFGLPCVVSNVGGMSESVINNETGFLCDPKDVEGFSDRIVMLIENKTLAKNLGDTGKLRAKTLFSEEVQKKEIEKLYITLMNNKELCTL